jgi:hypothetical protein
MTNSEWVSPEFFKLFARSEQILTSFKLRRESGHFDWSESRDLNDELNQLLGEMTDMVIPPNTDKNAQH